MTGGRSPALERWIEQARAVHIEDELARRGITLNGKVERAGPCPKCGGVDRFSINTRKQIFNCRMCKVGGDVIELVRHLDGVDFIEACTTLAGPPPATNGKDAVAPTVREILTNKYIYRDESGAVLFAVGRYEYQYPNGSFVLKGGKHKKEFRQKRPDPDSPGKWIGNVEGVRVVPYKLPELIEAIGNKYSIAIVEGEAKADLLWSWNVPATCNAMGAGKWKPEHSEFLRGADVVVLPDNDEPGRNHADVVAVSLQGIAKSVRVLELPGLGPKQDIIDWAKQGGTVEQLYNVSERESKPWAPRAKSEQQTADNKPAAAQKSATNEEIKKPAILRPTPFKYRPAIEIPKRAWLYGRHYLRGCATATIAPPGFTKSCRSLTELIIMALKRPLLGETPTAEEPLQCWYWSGEDELEEIERRIAAICDHHGLAGRELEGQLFCDSSQEMPLKIATMRRSGNVEFNKRDIKQITEGILDRKIDVFIIDPLISIHSVPESDNVAMDQVVKKFAAIAGSTNCGIDIDHHTRKLAPGQTEITADDARGAGAIIGAVRASRVINRMTTQQADEVGLSDLERQSYFRVGRAKANRTPPELAKWSRVVSKILANGDNVGALEAWQYPDAFANVTTADMYAIRDLATKEDFRADSRAKNWIGKAIAERLNLNSANKADLAQTKRILKTWINNGVLAIDPREDDHRKKRDYIIPGRLKDGTAHHIGNADDE